MDRPRIFKHFLYFASRINQPLFSKPGLHANLKGRPIATIYHCPSYFTCRNIKNGGNPLLSGLRSPKADRSTTPSKTRKAAKNYSRKPYTAMEDNLSEEDEEEEQVKYRDTLPHFVEVSAHCASDVKKICTLLSEESEKDKRVDSILKIYRHKLSPELVLGVLKNYRRIGRERTLDFFSWAGRQKNYRHNNEVVDYMADFFGRRKLFDDLRCLLKAMSAPEFETVTSRTVSIAVRFLGRAGRIQEALWVFEEMEVGGFNCKPSNLVFNNVLYVLCKCNAVSEENLVACVEKGLSVFKKMERPDSFSYSNVIIGLCRIGNVEQALEIFEEMCGNGFSPTRTAVNNLIGKLCEANKKNPSVHIVKFGGFVDILVPNLCSKNHLKQAMGVFWKVSDLGVLPSAFVVKTLIDEFSNSGKVEEALRIFNFVSAQGLRQDEETHHIILQVMFRVGWFQEACNIFSRMISEGVRPKIHLYNSVISALCKAGHLKAAEKYFYDMKKTRCLPNNVTYTALIHGHCRANNWQAASTWLDELLGLGWCAYSHTFHLVDSLLRNAQKHALADKLWQKMMCLHIHKECKAGEWEAPYQRISEMLEKGFSPPLYTVDLVDHALRKAGKWEMAQNLFQRAEQKVTM